MRKVTSLLLLITVFVFSENEAFSGKMVWVKESAQYPNESRQVNASPEFPSHPLSSFISPQSAVGITTGIWGFYDFQSYGSPCRFIQVNPTSPSHIHTMMTVKTDSADGASVPSRRISYSYSSDGGNTWSAITDNSQTLLPNGTGSSFRSGFGSLQLVPGVGSGNASIVTHGKVNGLGNAQTLLFLDATEGEKNFSEFAPPQLASGTDEPLYPQNVYTSNGLMAIVAQRTSANTIHKTRMSSSQVFENYSDSLHSFNERSYAVVSGPNGKVAIITKKIFGGLYYMESTDNGQTFTTPTLIYNSEVIGNDTMAVQWTGFDGIYMGTDLFVVFVTGQASEDDLGNLKIAVNNKCRLMLWKKSTNTSTVIIDKNNAPGTMLDSLVAASGDTVVHTQYNHAFPINFPTVGKTPDGNLLIACDYFQQGVADAQSWNYSNILFTSSSDNGSTWRTPKNITNSPDMDDRYVGISSWNPNSFAYLQFQEDGTPGASITPDSRPVSRTYQKVIKYNYILNGVEEKTGVARNYHLAQNYPNPFNASTQISFYLPASEFVTLKIYNVLGEEMMVVAQGQYQAGEHTVTFSANNLPSGMYFYKIQAEKYVEIKKMILLK